MSTNRDVEGTDIALAVIAVVGILVFVVVAGHQLLDMLVSVIKRFLPQDWRG